MYHTQKKNLKKVYFRVWGTCISNRAHDKAISPTLRMKRSGMRYAVRQNEPYLLSKQADAEPRRRKLKKWNWLCAIINRNSMRGKEDKRTKIDQIETACVALKGRWCNHNYRCGRKKKRLQDLIPITILTLKPRFKASILRKQSLTTRTQSIKRKVQNIFLPYSF